MYKLVYEGGWWSSFILVHVSGKRQRRLCDGGAEVSELSAVFSRHNAYLMYDAVFILRYSSDPNRMSWRGCYKEFSLHFEQMTHNKAVFTFIFVYT